MTDKPRIVLIDLSSLFWTNFHVNAEGGIREPRSMTLEAVKRCHQPGELVAICCDSGRSFRKDLSADYKANREKQPQAAYGELNKTKDRLRADGYLLWEVENMEADDVIATAAKSAAIRGHDVRICSADKDLFQCLNVQTDILRTHTWEVWDSRKVTEKLLIDVGQMRDFLALVGDSSDNVPGCPKVGGKTAADLLTRYETLDRIYEALDAGKQVAGTAVEKSLRENRASVELSRKLVTLRYDVPINFDEIYQKREVMPLIQENDQAESAAVASDDATNVTMPAEESTSVLPAEAVTSIPVTTALVPVEYERQLEPRSFSDTVIAAKVLFNSRLYQKFPTYQALAGAILRGREMGYGAGAALDMFHVMEDERGGLRLMMHAHAIIDRAMLHPECEYFKLIESTAESCTYEAKSTRSGITRHTYTIEDAKLAELVRFTRSGKPNMWMKRPKEQLRKTCGVQLTRIVFPGAAMGLYCMAELGGEE